MNAPLVLTLNENKMAKHIEKGNKGEEAAVVYLAENDYRILQRNWRYYHKELDIIAEKDDKLFIFEVKSRRQNSFSDPSEVLSYNKMRHIIDAAEAYIMEFNIEKEVQFDLLVVLFGDGVQIKHYKEAIIPGVNW